MIYVHVPFCRSFCTYCDFYSEVAARCRKADDALKQEALFDEFIEAVCAEALTRTGDITDEVNTLYIGGGTPSVLPLSAFGRLVGTLSDLAARNSRHQDTGVLPCQSAPSPVAKHVFDEFTVEVNPEDIVEKGHAYVEGLLDLGVNRISMGVQSFDDAVLKFMNRRHSAAEAVRAYAILEEAGVRNISIDLIFGLPQLSMEQWRETLDKALSISSRGVLPQHISSYQLSVEPGSMLARLVEKGVWSEAPEEVCHEQYSVLCETLATSGYNHYEISNFARPGCEAVHNSAYWRHVPYVGLGPGAHSYIADTQTPAPFHEGRCSSRSIAARQWNRPDLQSYLVAGRLGDFSSIREGEILTLEQLDLEHIMLGLRTSTGLPAAYLRSHCDPAALSRAISLGHLVPTPPSHPSSALPQGSLQETAHADADILDDTFLRIPERHFFISDSIISALV